MEGSGFTIGCMVGMNGTGTTMLTAMTCLCDTDRCNGLSANALAGEAQNTLPATQQPASCCPVVLLHRPVGFVWRLLLYHPNYSRSTWSIQKQPNADPMGRCNSMMGQHDATLWCVRTLRPTAVGKFSRHVRCCMIYVPQFATRWCRHR